MHECHNYDAAYTRRDFLTRTTLGLGAATLASLMNPMGAFAAPPDDEPDPGILGATHFPARVKRIIYLLQSGAPSQLDLFDYKPALVRHHGEELPPSVRGMQRLTGMTAGQKSFPMVQSPFAFRQQGESDAWVSSLMPYTSQIVDELCFVKSMYTEAINHDPAITFLQSGSQQPGRPSMGSWLSYGLGSENSNLPAFVVLVTKNKMGQPLYARLWGNGFLPSHHQGVQFRAGKDPVLYLSNPPGIGTEDRRRHVDVLRQLQELQYENLQDPEIEAKIAQYELAFRMQTSVPEVMNLDDEPESILDLYGEDARNPGTFAANCLLARRLAERGVRFIQLYHQGWDHHGGLPQAIRTQAKETDQASAALVLDLKQRGMLDDTLVIWGGEFGRTNYSQGKLTAESFGRDHHPRCFTLWMAGGGVKKGLTYGATDDLGYNIAHSPVHIHDFQATVLHLLGIDHERLIFRHQGRRYRLTDVHGHVVDDLLA
ncbi:MAG: DUF1501 domain-containing protein [Bacteroidota bacterium]|nr:DUF1501 domain-containing protein [Bacteroidota bacterium]